MGVYWWGGILLFRIPICGRVGEFELFRLFMLVGWLWVGVIVG